MNEDLDFDFIFTKGKFKGKSIAFVISVNPGYISWAKENAPYLLKPNAPRKTEEEKQASKPLPKIAENVEFWNEQTPYPQIEVGEKAILQNLKHLDEHLNGRKYRVVRIWLNTVKMQFQVVVRDRKRNHIKYKDGLLTLKPDQYLAVQ